MILSGVWSPIWVWVQGHQGRGLCTRRVRTLRWVCGRARPAVPEHLGCAALVLTATASECPEQGEATARKINMWPQVWMCSLF